MTDFERIRSLEARIEYLEDITRSMSEALELARSTGNIRIGPDRILTCDEVVKQTDDAVRRILPVQTTCYLFADTRTFEFLPGACFPDSSRELCAKRADQLIDNGSFAWALREPHAITAVCDGGEEMLLHAIGEGREVRGMFMADMGGLPAPDVSLELLSILIQKCDTALRTLDLFDSVNHAKRSLEEHVERLQQSEQRLKEEVDARAMAEARYRDLMNEASVGIFRSSVEGRLRYANPAMATMHGYASPEEMIETIEDVTRELYAIPDDRKAILSVLEKDGHVTNFETKMKTRDGRFIWVNINCRFSSYRADGEPAIEGFIQDITARKNAENESAMQREQLRQADKMAALGILVAGVAHEINNPNGVITLNTPILAKTWQSITPILDRHLEANGDFSVGGMPYSLMRTEIPYLYSEIQDSGMRIKRIVEDLKDFARQDMTGEYVDVDLNEVAETAARLVQNKISKSTSSFTKKLDPNLPPVRGNAQRLEQVVVNLLINACQALSDRNAALELSVRHDRAAGTVRLSVRDEGQGIDEDNLRHVMDPFYTTKRDIGGTGLGLAVSAGIIQDHGGRLLFESKRNRGTTATIILPVAKDPVAKDDEVAY